MRRVTTLVLVAGGTLAAVAGGALARSRIRGRAAAIPKPVTGIFPNGMAYLRWGTGPKTLLWIPGGPGNTVPSGMFLSSVLLRAARPLVEDGYTLWVVARKQNMPKGHAMADMAEDYAGLIADELGGKVDLVVGVSYGGVIGFYLAARHPDRFGHIAIVGAAYDANEEGKTLDYDFARLRSEGRNGEASALMLRQMAPGLRVPGVARVLGAVMARLMFGPTHPYFASDMMVEAEAEMAFDAREVLPDISVPVLLVCGDEDMYIPKELYEETARLIPDCTLRMYAGIGHVGAVRDTRFPQDVLDFVRRWSADRPEHGAERPTASEEPARRRIHQDIWIAAPVEEVFALYCDATRWRELVGADMGAITSVSGPIDQVGTTFEGTMRIAGRKITGTGRIVEVEPPRLVRVQATGPGAMGFVYRFEPDGNGTRFSADAEYEITSALSKLADKVVLHGYMDRAMRHLTGKMKEMAEAKIPVTT
jgi:pimeloyl-ACP methyl ester carboxylesterase/uncharacterized protein YndB with AHSA1/START domain